MSYPTNPLSALSHQSLHTLEYTPQELTRLKRRHRFWAFVVITSTVAWLVLFFLSFTSALPLIAMLACVAMLMPLVAVSSIGGEARHDYLEVKRTREIIEEAFRVAHGFLNPAIHLSNDALFRATVEVETPGDELSPVLLRLVPFNPETNSEDARRETLEYYVSLTKVETIRGPKISAILEDLRFVLIQDKRFHEANERMKQHFPTRWDPRLMVPRAFRPTADSNSGDD